MVYVPGGRPREPIDRTPLPSAEIAPFFIDRYEVTNRAYKEFVDAGGYERRSYWEGLDFSKDGQPLSFDDAMRLFVDATGRPGPATWELGNYPDGRADYPVTGISWYEAMAYARYRGKSLPTLYHWIKAALPDTESRARSPSRSSPLSNFASDRPRAGRKSPGRRTARHLRHVRQRSRVVLRISVPPAAGSSAAAGRIPATRTMSPRRWRCSSGRVSTGFGSCRTRTTRRTPRLCAHRSTLRRAADASCHAAGIGRGLRDVRERVRLPARRR